jgi:hypothetical protein
VAGFLAAVFFFKGFFAFAEPMETRLIDPRTGARFFTVFLFLEAGFTKKIGMFSPLGHWIKTTSVCLKVRRSIRVLL